MEAIKAIAAHLANWVIAGAVVFAVGAVAASFDMPTETDAAAAVALDLQDAITDAQVAHNTTKETE